MGFPQKLVLVHGFLGKTEGSYGAGGSLSTATDGILADELPKLVPGYVNDGARPAPPGMIGYQRGVAPSGKFFELPFKHAVKFPGSAYSASVFSTAHNPLRWCGFDAAVTLTGGSEKWVYTPTPGQNIPATGVGSAYGRNELWPLTAILGDFTWGFKGPEVPIFDFTFKGILGTYTDAAVPTITYPYDARDAIKATNATLSLYGASQFAVREATIKLGRVLQPRSDVTTGGFLGYAPGKRTPTLEVLLETPAIATQDFFVAWEQAVLGNWSLNLANAGQYNRIKWSGAGLQLMGPPKFEDDGIVALSRLSFRLLPSSLTASDDLSITTD